MQTKTKQGVRFLGNIKEGRGFIAPVIGQVVPDECKYRRCRRIFCETCKLADPVAADVSSAAGLWLDLDAD